jgi:hypothetical protein
MNNIFQHDFTRGIDAEKRFAEKHLYNYKMSSKNENMFEHWDIAGILKCSNAINILKFDVKAMKKINKQDINYENDYTWIEGTNVKGNNGWIKGKADYIVFERLDNWTLVKRENLYQWIVKKLEDNNYQKGKGLYQVYQRENRKDKITLIKYSDIPINNMIKLPL